MKLGLMILLLLMGSSAFAESVKGYFKSNGTYVESYQRSDRNNTQLDNYSTKGNTNPYTGKQGTKYPSY